MSSRSLADYQALVAWKNNNGAFTEEVCRLLLDGCLDVWLYPDLPRYANEDRRYLTPNRGALRAAGAIVRTEHLTERMALGNGLDSFDFLLAAAQTAWQVRSWDDELEERLAALYPEGTPYRYYVNQEPAPPDPWPLLLPQFAEYTVWCCRVLRCLFPWHDALRSAVARLESWALKEGRTPDEHLDLFRALSAPQQGRPWFRAYVAGPAAFCGEVQDWAGISSEEIHRGLDALCGEILSAYPKCPLISMIPCVGEVRHTDYLTLYASQPTKARLDAVP